jgi:hypothetical protein
VNNAPIEEWNKQAKQFNKKIVNTNYYDLLKYSVIILAIGVLIFGYMSYNNKFQDKINIPDCNCPELTCPDIPNCPSCPANNVSLDCGDVIIPSTFNVNLTNETA